MIKRDLRLTFSLAETHSSAQESLKKKKKEKKKKEQSHLSCKREEKSFLRLYVCSAPIV